MKYNVDCIRDVMFAVDEIPYRSDIWLSELFEKLPKYTEDEIEYTCVLLATNGYINAEVCDFIESNGKTIGLISGLTLSGYSFLESIRPHRVWDSVKKHLPSVGLSALDALLPLIIESVKTVL